MLHKEVNLKLLVPDSDQPRQEFDTFKLETLKSSIRDKGILVPIVVEKMKKKNTLLIIDGERRYKAATQLELKTVPVIIKESMTPGERMVLRFHLQEQHQSWSSFDKARAIYFFMNSEHLSVGEVSKILGMSPGTVAKWVGILDLSKRTQEKAVNKRIAFSYLSGIARIAPRFMDISNMSREEIELALINKVESKAIGKWTDMSCLRRFMNMPGNEKLKVEFLKKESMTVRNLLGITPEGRSIELDQLCYRCSYLSRLINKYQRANLNKYLSPKQKLLIDNLIKTSKLFIK